MPEVSRFYGIIIRFYFRDHPPTHFHAIYAEHEALGEDFFVPARQFQFVRFGGHRTPEKFHRFQPFSKAHALNLRIPKTNTLPAMSNAQEGSGTTLPPTPIE